jgi:Flp pilus assembly protein TadD
MGLVMMRFASSLAALLLCGSVLSGCASDSGSALGNLGQHKNVASQADDSGPPTDIASGVRQAQLARLAGRYDDAIHTLSQMMLLASDDPRVVGEYGKTLVEKGRPTEAIDFLTRATELQPKDWTLYSALGVAYDEAQKQDLASQAYTHALALKPDEPSILNNYALSRMLANDPAMARQLMASAAGAGGASDPKIARNITLVNSLAASAPVPVAQAAVPASQVAARAPAAAPAAPVAAATAQPAVPAAQKPAPQVVMEAVPVDPLAGPVKSHAAKPQAKPAAKPDDKAAPAAEAKAGSAKTAIPDLRQAALNY